MKLSEAEISEIVQLLRDADFDDLELEWGDIYFRIARRSAIGQSIAFQPQPGLSPAIMPTHPAPQSQPAPAAQPNSARAASDTTAAPSGLVEVRSSLMGTIYRSPQPGDPPFVDTGTSIQPGDTLCLLEVMKVFTALKAEIAGSIERVLVSDGDLVEYGQVIMWVRPA